MKVGDLVNFYSTYRPFVDSYRLRNPGIVLDDKVSVDPMSCGTATVLWSDGTVTSEHSTYLSEASDENR